MAYRQGLLLKRFKESNKFVEKLQEINVSRAMVYFKIKLILEKYLRLKKSSLSINFQKLLEND